MILYRREVDRDMFNTIILLTDEALLTSNEYKKFTKGDLILGIDNNPKEIGRWVMEDKEEALKELSKHKCRYRKSFSNYRVIEYALMYCETDEEGEVVDGADYDLAKEEVEEED